MHTLAPDYDDVSPKMCPRYAKNFNYCTSKDKFIIQILSSCIANKSDVIFSRCPPVSGSEPVDDYSIEQRLTNK